MEERICRCGDHLTPEHPVCLGCCGDADDLIESRNAQLGDPVETHRLIATAWSDYTGCPISAADVAEMMALLKDVRACRNIAVGGDPTDSLDDADAYREIARRCREAE